MRLTLILDEDVAAKIERLREERGSSPEELVNEALREGLNILERQSARGGTFRTASVDLGACRIRNLDKVTAAIEIAETDKFRRFESR